MTRLGQSWGGLGRFVPDGTSRNGLQVFGFAFLCVAVAAAGRFSVQPILGYGSPWILFYPATALSAWFGGLKGGLTAAALSILIALYLWIDPVDSWRVNERSMAMILLYALSSVIISYSAELWHRSQKELHVAKQQLETHAGELEKHVEERTVQLKETIAELERFSYTISHDLRSPLRAIRSFAQVVVEDADDKLDPETTEYLARIQKSAERMDRLINDVLVYSRAGKTELEFMPVNLDEIVDDISKEYGQVNLPHVEFTIQSPLGWVLGNPALLVQCFSNLMGNAAKFVPDGAKAKIRIWSERQGATLKVNVRDNGVGIPREYHEKIFQMFERVHSGGPHEGTGIGLAVVKRAVDRMNGRVGVESKVGEGSTFWIELPVATPPRL